MDLSSRAAHITTESQAAGVNIATWFLASTFIIMYLSRQTVKYVMLRKFQVDDYLMTAATVFALALSFAYSIAADNGLGNKLVSAQNLEVIQKAYYTADILYIVVLCFVKISLVLFFNNIAVDEMQKKFIVGLGAFCAVSTLFTLFAAAFQCGAHQAWKVMTLDCFDQTAFWISFGVLDILTDACLVLISIMLVWDLHIPITRKAVVVGCFAPRVLVIATSACRLVYLAPINAHNYPAFEIWVSVVCAEVQICLSISTACVPCIKPFFEGVEAGVWQSDHLRRQGFSINDLYSKGYAKASEDPESSQRLDSVTNVGAEQMLAASVQNSDELQVLPTFEGGKWRVNM